MNILKWLKSKAGKMPISIAQIGGIAAVVGAAGFGAMTYLSSPSTDNNAFIPPSVYEQQGNVQYVAQSAGGGQYASNGEVASAFHATQSDSIRLANQQFERENQARALEDADIQPAYAGEDNSAQMPKAYQMGQADLDLGMGSTGDKQLNGSLEVFSQLQNQLSGIGDVVNNAQAKAAAAQQGGAQAGAASGTSGQTAAQLANASRNWGQGGLTRAGSGGGIDNSFALQNSGKNQGGQGAEAAAAMAQMGNVMADARAALGQMQEGTRMRSRANFGPSDGLGSDRNASGQRARRLGKGGDDVTLIRKQSAAIAKNKTNTATAGMDPFLASANLSGGITVDGSVTTGQGYSSSDLSTASQQLRGVRAGLSSVENTFDNRTKDRHKLREAMWIALPLTLACLYPISLFVFKAKFSSWPMNVVWYALAAILTLVVLGGIYKLFSAASNYSGAWGDDGYTYFAKGLAALLTGSIGLAWLSPTTVTHFFASAPWVVGGIAAAVGFGGAGVFSWLSHKGEGAGAEWDDSSNTEDIDARVENLKGEQNASGGNEK